MKGKKLNTEFVANFIAECASQGLETPNQIVDLAKQQINQIDEEIKSITVKKQLRSQLLDVITIMDQNIKSQNLKSQDAKILSLASLNCPDICQEICLLINQHNTLNIDNAIYLLSDKLTVNYCIKQLLEHKILDKQLMTLKKGIRYKEYMNYISGNI